MHALSLNATALAASPILRSRFAAEPVDGDMTAGWLQRGTARRLRV